MSFTTLQEIGPHDQNMVVILIVIVNMNWGKGRRATQPFTEHENLHFDNEQDVHTSFKNMRKAATARIWIYKLSRTNCVFHVLVGKTNRLRPALPQYDLLCNYDREEPAISYR